MIAALRSEYRKFVSTRLWWVLLLAAAGYTAFLAGTFGFVTAQSAEVMVETAPGEPNPFLDTPSTAISIYTAAVAFAYVFPLVVGALSVTGEFRHKTITPTLLALPHRSTLIGAKLLAAVPVGLLFGLVATAAGVAVGAGILAASGAETYLGDPDVLAAVGRSVLALTVWTVVGVGLGTAMTNQVVVIVVALAFTQFVEPLVRLALGLLDEGRFAGVSAYLPGAAGEAIVGESLYSAMSGGGIELLGWWQGLLVLVGYALLFALLGRLVTFRRDIT